MDSSNSQRQEDQKLMIIFSYIAYSSPICAIWGPVPKQNKQKRKSLYNKIKPIKVTQRWGYGSGKCLLTKHRSWTCILNTGCIGVCSNLGSGEADRQIPGTISHFSWRDELQVQRQTLLPKIRCKAIKEDTQQPSLVSTHTPLCMRNYIHTHTHTHTCAHIHTHAHTHKHACTHVCATH